MNRSSKQSRTGRVSRVHTVVVALGFAVAVAACGGSSGPEALSLLSGVGGQAKNAAGAMDAAPSAEMRMALWNVTYKVEGTLPNLGDSADAWKLGKVSTDDALVVAKAVADELGVRGKFIPTPGDKSSYSLGYDSKDGTGMWLYLGSPREPSWSYYSGANAVTASMPVCEKSDDGMERCSEPAPVDPPKNLPTRDEASARAREVMTAAGADADNFRYVASKDDWGTYVQAVQKFDGLESFYSSWFSFGENGSIVSASGTILSPVKGDTYPLISPTKAVDRLSSPMFGMPMYGMAKGGAAVDTAVAPESSDSSDSGTKGAPDSTDATAPDDSVPVDSIPEPEPTVIPITDARLSLLPAYLADGRVALLPAYTFSNSDGDVGSVFAVEDKYISFDQPAPQTGDEPKPIEPGAGDSGSGSSGSDPGSSDSDVSDSGTSDPGSGAVDVPAPGINQAGADELVGLTEGEATKVAEGYGWVVRVAERDGEYFMLTADYNADRVNLYVSKGVVTAVKIG